MIAFPISLWLVILCMNYYNNNTGSPCGPFVIICSLQSLVLTDSLLLHSLFSFKHVNYQDPNLNVAYPLFSVHGNHDDPTGVS